jgi:hypothetical protein
MTDTLRAHIKTPETLLLWPPCFLSSVSDKRYNILKLFSALLSATLWKRVVDWRYSSKHSYPRQLEENVRLHCWPVYPRGKFPLVPIYIASWIELSLDAVERKMSVPCLESNFIPSITQPIARFLEGQEQPRFFCDVVTFIFMIWSNLQLRCVKRLIELRNFGVP